MVEDVIIGIAAHFTVMVVRCDDGGGGGHGFEGEEVGEGA